MSKLTFIVAWIFCAVYPLKAQELVLLFAGDAMQHQSQINYAFRDGKYDYSSCFQYIKNEVSAADIAIVNLEVTLAGKPYSGYPQFSAPDEYAVALKETGFDVFLNANNHIVDRSNHGIIRTLSVLDSIKIAHTGVFRDQKERDWTYPLIIKRKGICLALLNCTYGTNGFSAAEPVIVNYIDKEQIREDIQKAKAQKADVIIANMHWGLEYKLIQNREQEDLAAFLAEEGVDLIIGAHPHVVQPSKATTDENGNITRVTVYSLGNLVSGMVAPNTDGGQMIKIKLKKENDKVSIQSAEYSLIYRYKAREKGKLSYVVVPVNAAEKNDSVSGKPLIQMDADSYLKMKQFAAGARKLFNKYNIGVKEYEISVDRP
jgi:poly-gamma-glutamate synthesis protein (capsule biosynthesis protein)